MNVRRILFAAAWGSTIVITVGVMLISYGSRGLMWLGVP